MVIFNSYVSLPEGNTQKKRGMFIPTPENFTQHDDLSDLAS